LHVAPPAADRQLKSQPLTSKNAVIKYMSPISPRAEGSGTTEHATPTLGEPHIHPTGADGEKNQAALTTNIRGTDMSIWKMRAEIEVEPGDLDLEPGYTKGFMNVVICGTTEESIKESLSNYLSSFRWKVLSTEDVQLVEVGSEPGMKSALWWNELVLIPMQSSWEPSMHTRTLNSPLLTSGRAASRPPGRLACCWGIRGQPWRTRRRARR
jgi:hypothetical protein